MKKFEPLITIDISVNASNELANNELCSHNFRNLKIISRNSTLALYQANEVKLRLCQLYPNILIDVMGISTTGDHIVDRSLAAIGGKGLFTAELELALKDGLADLAVHSAKDLPASLPPEFTLSGFMEREDSRDVFVANLYSGLNELPDGAIIGTASARRAMFIKKYYPHCHIKLLRGNIHTRLRKLDEGEYDGIILAAAGLHRLNLRGRITEYLDPSKFIPAIAQGALAIEILADNHYLSEILDKLNHADTDIAVKTEREVGRILQVGCSVPIAVHAWVKAETLYINSCLVDTCSGKTCQFYGYSFRHEYLSLAAICADSLLSQGAYEILKRYN
ncbi:MAG: hydroxymethylbilane synthase [Burkholderiales bacterium]|nr:hydroxymethylbilane synthase [Burkholderiales bacterium]